MPSDAYSCVGDPCPVIVSDVDREMLAVDFPVSDLPVFILGIQVDQFIQITVKFHPVIFRVMDCQCPQRCLVIGFPPQDRFEQPDTLLYVPFAVIGKPEKQHGQIGHGFLARGQKMFAGECVIFLLICADPG